MAKKPICASNKVDQATTTNKNWGCVVPKKFGKTTNYRISPEDRKKEGIPNA